ncbi:TPA: hypothetical protein ACS8CD_003699 [Providencia alcalifaciens]
MSDINFEALGRCTHLKEALSKAVKERNTALSSLERIGARTNEYDIQRVKHVDVQKLRKAIDDVEKADIELTSLIEEYNSYASQAGLKEITIVKNASY